MVSLLSPWAARDTLLPRASPATLGWAVRGVLVWQTRAGMGPAQEPVGLVSVTPFAGWVHRKGRLWCAAAQKQKAVSFWECLVRGDGLMALIRQLLVTSFP